MIHDNSILQEVELNYFRLNLLSYLRDAHPDKAGDLKFIAARGDLAAEAYSDAIKNGFDHIQAAGIADSALFQDLIFSPFNTIVEILWNEFQDEIPPDEAQQKAKELLPYCKPVFAQFIINDEFAETPEYNVLYTELTGTIQILLENELQ